MAYVDGFLIPVPEANKAQYMEMAAFAAPIFIEHGAIHVSENWDDDVTHGHTTDFYRAVKAEEGEKIVFSWITWPSKEARDAGNKAAMEDERFHEWMGKEVFNSKRMIFSGFANFVDVRA